MDGLWFQVAIGIVAGGSVLLGIWHALHLGYWCIQDRISSELTEGQDMLQAADRAIAQENASQQLRGEPLLTQEESRELRWEVSKAFMVRKYMHRR
jgi:hypothetical protein